MKRIHKLIIAVSFILIIILTVLSLLHGTGARSIIEAVACIAVTLAILNEDKIIKFEINIQKMLMKFFRSVRKEFSTR